MSRYHSYLKNAVNIINEYKIGSPFSIHLKNFFSKNKKIGSQDRKAISGLCYQYFRCSLSLKNESESLEQRILKSVWICSDEPSEFLGLMAPEWNNCVQYAIKEKLRLLNYDRVDLFEYNDLISDTIDKEAFAFSLYKQPSVFLRIRPNKNNTVMKALGAAGIDFTVLTDYSLEIKNNISLDKCIKLNRDAVIQDLSSQKVFDMLPSDFSKMKPSINVWDVCAASGGKSILLFDKLMKNIKITASDVREKMLFNLKRRFQEAQIPLQQLYVQDVTKKSGLSKDQLFDIVICDVPCTGSGTWSRTPEQYVSFNSNSLKAFNDTQGKIVDNTLPHLKKDGLLFYITCSVFKAENESQVNEIATRNHLEIIDMNYIRGYEKNADTMFVAVMKRLFRDE